VNAPRKEPTRPHKRTPRIIAVPPHEMTTRKKIWLSNMDVDFVHENQNGSVNVVPSQSAPLFTSRRRQGPWSARESVDMCHGGRHLKDALAYLCDISLVGGPDVARV